MRRLFTCVIFQASCFKCGDGNSLREVLNKDRNASFDTFQDRLDILLETSSVKEMVGDEYDKLCPIIKKAKMARNKIFHGQFTNQYLSKTELGGSAAGIRCWYKLLSEGAQKQIGYDSFARISFQKLDNTELTHLVNKNIKSEDGYRNFLKKPTL